MISFAIRLRFWAIAASVNSILGAARTAQPKATEPQDALEVREPHLDALAIVARALEAFGTWHAREQRRARRS